MQLVKDKLIWYKANYFIFSLLLRSALAYREYIGAARWDATRDGLSHNTKKTRSLK